MNRKELCAEEKLLSYSKYYYLDMEPINPLSQQILDSGPIPVEKALDIYNRDDLLKPGYLPCECGYCVMPDGSGFMAHYVYMPNVTVEMLDWWFCWHFITPPSVPEGNGNLRYKLWNPPCHWDTGFTSKRDIDFTCDSSLPMSLRHSTTHAHIVESMLPGQPLEDMYCYALPLDEFGFNSDLMKNREWGSIAGAISESGACVTVHYYRQHPTCGIEVRSRYWMGYTMENGKPKRVEGVNITDDDLVPLLYHNMMEYPHLAKFLPDLYREEHDKPLDVY